jgi:hypothetical protein
VLYKTLDVPAFDAWDNQRVIPLFGIEKLAAADSGDAKKKPARDNFSAELRERIRQIKPSPQYSYLVIIPIGAYEYWGPNSRGDAAFEDHICPKNWETDDIYKKRPYGYRTFLNGHFFAHHKNKPQKGHPIYGDVVFSNYHRKMHWVELIVRIFREPLGKDQPDILGWIDSGMPFDVSMGMYAAADICPVCKNVRRREEDPGCVHVSKRNLGKIMEDGTICCMINLFPKFHDISAVYHGADSLAHGLLKVASAVHSGVGATKIPSTAIERAVHRISRKGLLPRKGKVKVPSNRASIRNALEKRSAIRQIGELFSKEASADPKALLDAGEKFGPSLLVALVRNKIALEPQEFSAAYLGAQGGAAKKKGLLLLRKGVRIPYPSVSAVSEVPAALERPGFSVDSWVRENLLMDKSVHLSILRERLRLAAESVLLSMAEVDLLEKSAEDEWRTTRDSELESAYSTYLGMLMGAPDYPLSVRRRSVSSACSDPSFLGLEKVASLGTLLLTPAVTIPLWLMAKSAGKSEDKEASIAAALAALAASGYGKKSAPATIIIPPVMPDLRPTAIPYDLLNSLVLEEDREERGGRRGH